MCLVWIGIGIGIEIVIGREKEFWSVICCSELFIKCLLSVFGCSMIGLLRRYVDVYWGDLDDCLFFGVDLFFKWCSFGKKL